MIFSKQMEMVLYNSEDGDVSVNAYIKDESLWVTQKAMSKLFGVDKSGISRHLKNIFSIGELDEKVVVAKLQQPLSMVQSKEKCRHQRLVFIVAVPFNLCLEWNRDKPAPFASTFGRWFVYNTSVWLGMYLNGSLYFFSANIPSVEQSYFVFVVFSHVPSPNSAAIRSRFPLASASSGFTFLRHSAVRESAEMFPL